MKKQTAVEWLEEQIKDIFYVAQSSEMTTKFQDVYQKAKAMEKEQIMNAYLEGESDADHSDDSALRFYNKTYGGDE